MEPAALVEAARVAFTEAQRRGGGREITGTIAGRGVRLLVAGDFFAHQLTRALSIGANASSPVELTVCAWDAASTGVRLDWSAWEGKHLGPVGIVEELTDDRYHVSFDLHAALVSVTDLQSGLAFHYVPDPSLMPAWEHTHPARLMWAAWARSIGLLTCHAAAVGVAGEGVLLVGSSGSGKSTTALVCLANGMDSAGDDYVLVEMGGRPSVHSLYTSSLLEVDHARRHDRLMPAIDHVAVSPGKRKAVMFANGVDGPALADGFQLVGIAALRVERGSTPRYAPASAGAVLRALAPSTLGQLGMVDAAGLRSLADLCRRLPCYELRLGDDPTPIPALVRSLIAEAAQGASVGAAASA